MKKNSTIFHIFSSIGTKVIVLLGSFIISVVLARFLGPEGKGIVTAIFVIPNLLVSIADLGIRQATAYYVGKKIYTPSNVYGSILVVWVITSCLSMVAALAYYLTGSIQQYGWILISIPLLSIPFMLLNKYMNGLLLGLQQINAINIKNILNFIINFIFLLILVVLLNYGIYGAATIHLIVALVTLMYSIFIIRKFVPKIQYQKGIAQSLISKGLVYAVALFILNLNYKIDILLLEKMTTPADVGIYSIGVSLSELIWQIPAAMGMVLFSKSANSKKDLDAINRSTKLLRISWIPIILGSALFWFLSPYFIRFLYGVEFIESISVIRILLPGIVAMVLFKILNADLAGRGYPLFALRVYVIALVLNIVLNILLIPRYDINGAAIASTISYSVGALLFSLSYKNKSQIRFSEMFILNKSDINLIKSIMNRFINKRRGI
ncbi:flippase [Halalkalibacter sp. AB-rgal2]|uniref:flippase n=1 Tax=Halalkalibacter sp. AB-rgal2 TaxID=3242695 RepID=UPI00359E3EEE